MAQSITSDSYSLSVSSSNKIPDFDEHFLLRVNCSVHFPVVSVCVNYHLPQGSFFERVEWCTNLSLGSILLLYFFSITTVLGFLLGTMNYLFSGSWLLYQCQVWVPAHGWSLNLIKKQSGRRFAIEGCSVYSSPSSLQSIFQHHEC